MHPTKGRDLTLRRLLATAAVLILFLLPSSAAAPAGQKDSVNPSSACSTSRGDFHREARKAVRRPPLTSRERQRVKRTLRCQVSPRSERNVRWHWGRYKSAYRRRLVADRVARVTPYPGPNGTRWAIPWPIVACESRGSWSAYNPSGALGPYQLLGKGAPWPVRGRGDRLAHHRIAHDLYAGGAGRSHWVC